RRSASAATNSPRWNDMDTTLDSSVLAAKTGDAPRNLLGRPTTRHRGEDAGVKCRIHVIPPRRVRRC
ncbi:hypothetical protein, partial [Burkholderia cenocepacia]|uniref:hypothetical protein n=1 Tax=Burkholderia cenocepacia TaxID=95486 RepID=UPI0024B7BFC3